jgi:AAA ATPase domain
VDAVSNPYSPGAGLRPAVLAGRESELVAFDAVITRAELGRSVRGPVLTGLRGVGKTVLLNELARRGEARDWMVVQLEVRSHGSAGALGTLTQDLAAALKRRQSKLSAAARKALSSIKGFSLTLDPSGSLGASLQLDDDVATTSGDVERDLVALALDVGRAAREDGIGVLVCADELQEMDRVSLEALTAAAHATGQREVPFIVAAAGLPNLPARLAEAKSYAERLFDYRQLGKLGAATAEQALTGPADAAGVTWAPAAVATVLTAADGYPYFLQEFGSATWQQATGPTTITAADAGNGVRLGQAVLDGGFFRSRWDRATPSERSYLVAMASDHEGASQTADIAKRMGRTQSNLGPIRAGLIRKGLVYPPEYGKIAFTVPGMAGFVQRYSSEE